ncbi:MAG: glycosyltransferase, partial [archaeon]|nr:glycosyltransferase [archaeon]
MRFSIVIGALNEEKYIAKTLATANAQKTSHEVEVIVGDGYSEDKTVEVAKKLGAKVVLEKNRSAAWERNAGSRIAKGEIICFTDADAEIP